MCWNWQSSLGFCIAEFILLSFLFIRNRYIDRYWVTLCFPIFIQQFCQFLVFKAGIDDDTTFTNCNGLNRLCSRIILVFTMAMPPMTSWVVYKTIVQDLNTTPKHYKSLWKFLLYSGIIFYLIIVIMELTDPEFCITVGPKGHLDYGASIRSRLKDIIGIELYLLFTIPYFLMPIICACFLYKPQWVMFPPSAFMLFTFIILFASMGTEGYSVIWCWTGSVISIWGVLYHYIGGSIRNRFSKYKTDNGHWCIRFCLKGSHNHYTQFDYQAVSIVDYESEATDIEINM